MARGPIERNALSSCLPDGGCWLLNLHFLNYFGVVLWGTQPGVCVGLYYLPARSREEWKEMPVVVQHIELSPSGEASPVLLPEEVIRHTQPNVIQESPFSDAKTEGVLIVTNQ